MTRQEAQAEAVRRWGPKAWVRWYLRRAYVYDGTRHGDNPNGSGDTWGAAFADADKRGAQ